MRWLARFLAWTTVLAAPAWLIGDAYHRALARATLLLLRIPSERMTFQPPEIPASHVLGVYAALCLASTRAPRARRFIALGVGLAGMVAVELLTGVLAVRWSLDPAHAVASPQALRLQNYVTGLPAWIGAPVVWLLLLGSWELPRRMPRMSSRDGRAGPRAR
jgi:hypothetical protein